MNEYAIREAADIEHQANLILGLFNRKKGAKTNKNENGVLVPSEEALKVEVLKNRGGSTDLEGVLKFNGNTGKIEGKQIEEENGSPF